MRLHYNKKLIEIFINFIVSYESINKILFYNNVLNISIDLLTPSIKLYRSIGCNILSDNFLNNLSMSLIFNNPSVISFNNFLLSINF